MKKIPKAEEMVHFLEAKGTIFPNKKEKLRAKNSFIEFAKLHVEAILKEKKEQLIEEFQIMREEGDSDMRTVIHFTNSILNAYPLTNIK